MIGLISVLKGISGEFELGRILWALATLALIAYQGVDIWLNKVNFNPVEFGAGAAAILAAGGFGISQKDKGVAKATEGANNVQYSDK